MQGNLTCRIGRAGHNQQGIEQIHDHFGHLCVGVGIHHFCFGQEETGPNHNEKCKHLEKYSEKCHFYPLSSLLYYRKVLRRSNASEIAKQLLSATFLWR